MTRINSGVVILAAAALLLAVPATAVFAQGNPKETGAVGGGRGAERGTPTPGASAMGAGGSGSGAGPTGGAMAPPASGSTGGGWSGGNTGTPTSSGSSPTYGDPREPRRSGNPRQPLAGEAPATEASPWYSRPRGNSPSTGTATVRTTPPAGSGPGGSVGSPGGGYPYGPDYGYYPGYYGSNGYYGNYGWGFQPFGWGGFGLGYSYYYDPFWSSYGGYPGYGYGSDYGGGYGWSTGSGYSSSQQRLTGSIRLKVKPAQATVYVDGYYSGRVDDFDGIFQKLRIEPGPHKVEISAQGFKSISFEVNIRAGETINFQGELEIIK